VRWYNDIQSEAYAAVREALPTNSTSWAVLTSPELVEEARRVFGPNVLILAFDQVPGIEFQAVVLYKGVARKVLATKDSELIEAALKASYIPPSVRSKTLQNHTPFIQWSGAYFTAITRARDLVVVIEPVASKTSKKSVKKSLQGLCAPEYCDYSRALPVSLTASTTEEWAEFIGALVQSGEMGLAQDLYARQLQQVLNQSFEIWCARRSLRADRTVGVYQESSEIDIHPTTFFSQPAPVLLTIGSVSGTHVKKETSSPSHCLSHDELRKYMKYLIDNNTQELRKANRLQHTGPLYDMLFTKVLQEKFLVAEKQKDAQYSLFEW
jgi:hypothetical protein